jgi:hypothetical protein
MVDCNGMALTGAVPFCFKRYPIAPSVRYRRGQVHAADDPKFVDRSIA